ncbi:short-chain fatty acid transporter [Hyunsoonleella aestuarii]|uniref:Short-chain fatty acid transporter n=2 Tax=Hyunsoonleella aestuarii TaxID=912802 RepID=A0ABP8EAG2_9FLAO
MTYFSSMKITKSIEVFFKRFMPSPFTIAILLTLITIVLALIFTEPKGDSLYLLEILSFWESGIWNNALLVFAYQMMLILVLGHVLVLSVPVNKIIIALSKNIKNTSDAVVLVSVTTMLMAFLNWGLGLIFGAILARKVGEHAQKHNIPLNYPLVGAAGYGGLMVWHGGISGSAPIKVAENNHIQDLMEGVSATEILNQIPRSINFDVTIFSMSNILIFGMLLVLVPLVLKRLSKVTESTNFNLDVYKFNSKPVEAINGAEKLDFSSVLGIGFGVILLIAFFYQYWGNLISLQITPNMLNFFMLALGVLLHKNFNNFLKAVQEAIKGTSGILIQFPLYFGIMGIMKSSGMVVMMSDFFVSVATESTLPIFTFFSAGLVNLFVPSGGGQWAIQGPIIIESALQLGVPLPKIIMALAYGDQVTNMLQPFWALPLLGITKLKAKEILPYTLILMMLGIVVFISGLILF